MIINLEYNSRSPRLFPERGDKKNWLVVAWSRNFCLVPAEVTSFVLLVLSKNGTPSVGPRFHLFVSDVNQGNEEAVRVQNFLA